jgi:hypothetical protein
MNKPGGVSGESDVVEKQRPKVCSSWSESRRTTGKVYCVETGQGLVDESRILKLWSQMLGALRFQTASQLPRKKKGQQHDFSTKLKTKACLAGKLTMEHGNAGLVESGCRVCSVGPREVVKHFPNIFGISFIIRPPVIYLPGSI